MNLISVVIASVIMGIMTLAATTQSTLLVDIQRERLQTANMVDIRDSLIAYYVDTGVLTTTLSNLDGYSSIDYGILKDLGGGQFTILDNAGALFSYNGSAAMYKAVILTPYGDGLDSSIATNSLTIANSEAFVLIAESEFINSARGKTKTKVDTCTTASANYNTAIGTPPASISDLIAGTYVEASKTIDEFGGVLLFDGSNPPNCYSKGRNGVDDAKGNDDIS